MSYLPLLYRNNSHQSPLEIPEWGLDVCRKATVHHKDLVQAIPCDKSFNSKRKISHGWGVDAAWRVTKNLGQRRAVT